MYVTGVYILLVRDVGQGAQCPGLYEVRVQAGSALGE